MSGSKESSGRRSVELEVEVPGTPEQVWAAIATGPGMTAWFVPTEVEERVGGTIAFHLMPGMDSVGTVQVWNPPSQFAYVEPDFAPDAPPLATEVVLEAKAGGTCVVRMVHSLFTESRDWDDQLESMLTGWEPYFEVLRFYLGRCAGWESASLRLIQPAPGSEAEVWDGLARGLQLAEIGAGGTWSSLAGVGSELAGKVVRRGNSRHAEQAVVEVTQPAPGMLTTGAFSWGGSTQLVFNLFLYGPAAAEAVRTSEPAWQSWFAERFPSPEEPS